MFYLIHNTIILERNTYFFNNKLTDLSIKFNRDTTKR
jgi:hypothetical protein